MNLMVLPFVAVLVAPAASPTMGSISFPVSGNAECGRRFVDGMLALHSFMYDDAIDHFRAATKADPACSMARWGEAMASSHPLWGEEDPVTAKAALAAVVEGAKLTEKERRFLAVAATLWGEGEYRTRGEAWLKAADRMHQDFPDDDEVALQHALALIANSERLTNVRRLMESAAISLDVSRRKPNHPGAAHYLIHACDTADHAILALPAARHYARIAPSAAHALHMPAHIFVQLGMWEDVVSSNEASWAASVVDDKRRGRPSDQADWHSYAWLTAGYLELGRIKKADEMVRTLGERLAKEDGPETRFGYLLAVRHFLAETGRWERTDSLLAPLAKPLPLEAGEESGSMGCAMHAPGAPGKTRMPWGLIASLWAAQTRAEAAMRRGDPAGVTTALEPVKRIVDAMDPWKTMLRPEMKERNARFETAMQAGARAYRDRTPAAWDEAIASMRELAAIREPLTGGPSFGAPAQQMLGEMLLEAGKPGEALSAFDAALKSSPGMTRSLLGAARAARAAGNAAIAAERYGALATKWKKADPDVHDLAEVRAPSL